MISAAQVELPLAHHDRAWAGKTPRSNPGKPRHTGVLATKRFVQTRSVSKHFATMSVFQACTMPDAAKTFPPQAASMAVWAGTAILPVVIGVNMLGDGLRDALDLCEH